ncbi:MAG: quinolinate synthase NadA, partial [Bradyrhizobium icense]
MPITGLYGPKDFANATRQGSARPQGSAETRPAISTEPRRALPMPSLQWTDEVERATAPLYERVKHIISPIEWPLMAPHIKAINELKRERDAVILAHNYQTPEIFHCVADIVGDSLVLAIEASRVKAGTIVQCGVHFMAETSKILNPEKTVLIPDSRAGCSLASSITGADVRNRQDE